MGFIHVTGPDSSLFLLSAVLLYWIHPNLSLHSPVNGLVCVCVLSHVRLFVTLRTVAHQAPLSVGFSRQEYWNGLPCPPPGDLPNPGIEPASLMFPALADGFFPTSTTWEAQAGGRHSPFDVTPHFQGAFLHMYIEKVSLISRMRNMWFILENLSIADNSSCSAWGPSMSCFSISEQCATRESMEETQGPGSERRGGLSWCPDVGCRTVSSTPNCCLFPVQVLYKQSTG